MSDHYVFINNQQHKQDFANFSLYFVLQKLTMYFTEKADEKMLACRMSVPIAYFLCLKE